MSIHSRVERLERECGREGGPCADCARREEKAREPGPSYDRTRFEETDSLPPMAMNCRRCGRPYVINFVVVEPRETPGESSFQT